MKSMKIKSTLLFLLLILNATWARTQVKEFVIEGTVKGIHDQKIFLIGNSNDEDNEILQSTNILNGKFEFRGHLENPPAILDIRFEDKKYWLMNNTGLPGGFILTDNGEKIKIEISVDPNNIINRDGYIVPEVKVTSDYPVYLEFQKIKGEIYDKYGKYDDKGFNKLMATIKDSLKLDIKKQNGEELNEEAKVKLQKAREDYMQVRNKISEERNLFVKNYIENNPNSIVSLLLICEMIGPAPSKSPFYDKLTQEVKNSSIGVYYIKIVEKGAPYIPIISPSKKMMAEEVSVGKSIKDFTLQDPNGNRLNINSLFKEGEYILLDFWASWCAPCRAEIPNVLQVYNEYNNKGLKIVSISLDDKKESWLKAIKDERMPWLQLSDLQGFDGVAKIYGIISIPMPFLLDWRGMIIAKGQELRGENLHKVIKGLLDKK